METNAHSEYCLLPEKLGDPTLPKALLVRVVLLPKQRHLVLVEWWVEGFALLPHRVILVRYGSLAYFVPLPKGQVPPTIMVRGRGLRGQPLEGAAVENSVSMISPMKWSQIS